MIHLTNGNNGNFLTKPSANIRVLQNFHDASAWVSYSKL